MAEPLKNEINPKLVNALAGSLLQVDSGADVKTLKACGVKLKDLELKDRVSLVADALDAAMTGRTKKKLTTVVRLAEAMPFTGLQGWPLASFVERHGLNEPEASLQTMAKITEHFTCEFAIRPFLSEHLDLAMTHVHAWTESESEHPRRLASEGTRPKLPWGVDVPALLANPQIGLAVVEKVRHDSSEYVRRSVANHLNDVAKFDPDLVLATTKRWSAEVDTDMAMIRHALRTLVKQGDPKAMAILGFVSKPKIKVHGFSVTPDTVVLGDSVDLELVIESTATVDQRVVIDFVIHHVLANGKTSPKVFKWTTPTIGAKETLTLTKRRKIATASTRTYYPGHHQVDAQVAGKVLASSGFDLPTGS